MIPPHALLEVDAPNVGRDVGPLRAVQPSVRAPGERIRQRARVLHAEAGEQHFGIAVGHVVVVAVGIEQEIRDVEHEDAAVAERDARRQVQSADEVLGPVDASIAVGIFQNRDPIGSFRPPRRRLGNPVVDGPRIAVDLHPLESGRIGILQILHDPQPAPIVEFDANRLADMRLGRHEIDGKPVGNRHLRGRNLRRVTLCLCARRTHQRTNENGERPNRARTGQPRKSPCLPSLVPLCLGGEIPSSCAE
jgi:hypothetical protein